MKLIIIVFTMLLAACTYAPTHAPSNEPMVLEIEMPEASTQKGAECISECLYRLTHPEFVKACMSNCIATEKL